jgi:exosome complex component RRP42
LEDVQNDLTILLHSTLSHQTLHPGNLLIIPGKKAWCLNLDLVVLADEGNVIDVLFLAARSALWDTKVPRTRSIEYKARNQSSKLGTNAGASTSTDVDMDQDTTSGFDTRQLQLGAVDFELEDYWDEGVPLDGREAWPVGVTMNLVCQILIFSTVLFFVLSF